MVARLQEMLEQRPGDAEGHRVLARSLGALGRWPEARAAQARAVEIFGERAAARDLVELAEMMISAANGYVSPEAEAALSRALTLDPANPVGRYYSGLTLLQGGRPDLTYRIWSALLAEGPPDAPWIRPIEAEIDEVARLAGQPPRTPPRGPSGADVDAAGEMSPDDRQAMIEGMVAQLSERLATEGGPPEDWAQLIRSLGVLGRREQAAEVLAEARAKHGGDPAALAAIDAAARDAGLP
jgi:cytochrome c-type biogenesis protein CcmH